MSEQAETLPPPLLSRMRVQNYGPYKDATFEFTRLHALVGPNDSGKSVALRLIEGLKTRGNMGENLRPWMDDIEINYKIDGKDIFLKLKDSFLSLIDQENKYIFQSSNGTFDDNGHKQLREDIYKILFVKLHPNQLRQPGSLIEEGQAIKFETAEGHGLASIYDVLMARDNDMFVIINNKFKSLFQSSNGIRIRNISGKKSISVSIGKNQLISAEQMSEGMLYYLAFAALQHIDPPSILLIEEPENGLHPARIADIMRILREISAQTQVILTTHSPLVLNELQADEISILSRDPVEGTRVRRLNESWNFQNRSKVYSNGELWLAYCNGVDERDLFEPADRSQG